MLPLSSTALSGMSAASAALGAAAHNIANLQTPGFQRQVVSQREAATGGVEHAVERSAMPGPALERDVVEQLRAKNAFLANLAVFKTSDAMAGALLSLRA